MARSDHYRNADTWRLVNPCPRFCRCSFHIHTLLGISLCISLASLPFYHDSAACLLKDGEIVAAAQEERFTQKEA